MVICFGAVTAGECQYGNRGGTTVDQFGTVQSELYGRMLGPRYPHRWSDDGCPNYRQFFINYQAVPPVILKRPISGSVGPVGVPRIERLLATDPDDADLTYGVGDELHVVFNVATDRSNSTARGAHSGDRLYVDSLFRFNAQLGQDYSGEWRDDSTFAITVIDPERRPSPPFEPTAPRRRSTTAPSRCATGSLRATGRYLAARRKRLRRAARRCGPREPPRIVSVVGDDADHADVTVAYGDTLTIGFDRTTDLGFRRTPTRPTTSPVRDRRELPWGAVDALFNFSVPLARRTGRWLDRTSFQIMIVDGAAQASTPRSAPSLSIRSAPPSSTRCGRESPTAPTASGSATPRTTTRPDPLRDWPHRQRRPTTRPSSPRSGDARHRRSGGRPPRRATVPATATRCASRSTRPPIAEAARSRATRRTSTR